MPWEISNNLQEINKVCDKYPVNFNNICLLRYNKDNHSCNDVRIKNINKYKVITIYKGKYFHVIIFFDNLLI